MGYFETVKRKKENFECKYCRLFTWSFNGIFATKAFLFHFLKRSIKVKPYGITVTALCPGPVETEFQNVAGMKDNVYLINELNQHVMLL